MKSAVNKREICNSDTLTGQKQNIRSLPEELGDPGCWNEINKTLNKTHPSPTKPKQNPLPKTQQQQQKRNKKLNKKQSRETYTELLFISDK